MLREAPRRWRPLARTVAAPFELSWLRSYCTADTRHLVPVGNYWINPDLVRPDEPVYSLGVGADISFDLTLVERYGCKAWLFDPTPKSATLMQRYAGNTGLHFEPLAVWTHDGAIRFHYMESRTGAIKTGSVTNLYRSGQSIEVPCKRLVSLMSENVHACIGVLKMDIEGAAFDVLEDCLDSGIHPRQILVEFEKDDRHVVGFAMHRRLHRLMLRLRALGYDAHFFPRRRNATAQFEFAFVRSIAE